MSGHSTAGFRLHTGWAILVAVSCEKDSFCVLRRCRIELLPPDYGRFVYHEAAELPLPDAERLVESVRQIAEETAAAAISSALRDLKIAGACLPANSVSVAEDLHAVLRSHARIHAAEGALYAHAAAAACRRLKIPLVALPERQVWPRAAAALGVSEAELTARIADLRRTLGAPWTADHKLATAAALVG